MQTRNQPPIARALAALLLASGIMTTTITVHAADTPMEVVAKPAAAADDAMTTARKHIQAKQWSQAAAVLEKVVAKEPRNADAHNLLGFSYRWMNRMDESFASYGKALAIEPNHRGAHEYVGVAYLKVGKPEKAEEHLAKLQQICGADCEETRDLAAKLSEYKTAKR
jgi:Flp pilus assembly protein TadD